MKQIDITNKNKDLDLRRFGKGIYSKAKKSGSSDEGGSDGGGSSEGDEGTIDYEDIYQFYKQQFISIIPPDEIEALVIPEHFEDIIDFEGEEYESGTEGIWSTENQSAVLGNEMSVLFTMPFDENVTYIVYGTYSNTSPTIG